MDISGFFPIWAQMTPAQQELLTRSTTRRSVKKGTILHSGSADCLGLMLIISGQLRAYIISDEGKELTIYRLFELDTCLFSASCIMQSIQFDIIIQAEKDTEVWIIPPQIYQSVMNESAPVANYTRELMSSRFSEAMWLIEQVMWKSIDKRLSAFLLEEAQLEDTNVLKLTHETIANHMGTAREVVTRMLRYFQNEGMVKLSRGTVEILDEKALRALDI